MLKPHYFNPCKRQRSAQQTSQLNETPQSLPKRKKVTLSHREGRSRTPPAFYDNLSKIWLTKGALRELDRRNAQSDSSSLHRKSLKSSTRHTDQEQDYRSIQPVHEFFRHCTSRCPEDIKQFARHGGPDLLDLRGVCTHKFLLLSKLTKLLQYSKPIRSSDHAMSSIQSNSRGRSRKRASASSSRIQTSITTPTTTTANIGVYHRNFQQNLIDHGVFPYAYEYPDGRIPAKPDNWKDINQRLMQPRASLSPSRFPDDAFEAFVKADAHASKENKVIDSVIPVIEGKISDRRCVAGNVPFTNLDHLTDGALSSGHPDRFYGARPEQLNRQIRNQLSGRIVPSTQDDLPMAPNFFLAAKGPDGTLGVAGRQACYDGALGARGIQSLQSYGQTEPVYDNNAYTITSIYHGGQLKMYTSHPGQPTDSESPEYFMNQLRSFSVIDTPDAFRQGAAAYRNARDWAKEKRDQFIEAANERINTTTESPSLRSSNYEQASFSTAEGLRESETSADELALEEELAHASSSKRRRREI